MASRYLVSFCNNDWRLRLAIVTPQGIERLVDLGENLLTHPAGGTTGLCIRGGRIFVAAQSPAGAVLLALDRDYALQSEIVVAGAADLHGVAARGSEIIVVSTGTNQVLAIDPAGGGKPRIVWSDDGAGTDRDHLNDLCLSPNGALLTSRFGPRQPDSLRAGSVVEVETGKVLLAGLREPHSPCWWDSQLYVLESVTGDVIRARPGSAPERVGGIVGYARGLAMDKDHVVIGKSGYREISRGRLGDHRSAPLAMYRSDPDLRRRSGLCFIAQDSRRASWVDTTECGNEIYQILPIDD